MNLVTGAPEAGIVEFIRPTARYAGGRVVFLIWQLKPRSLGAFCGSATMLSRAHQQNNALMTSDVCGPTFRGTGIITLV
jgi:hypothetical protein